MPKLTELASGSTTASSVALVLPGAGYTTQAPLLYWSIGMLIDSGWRVIAAEWTEDGQHDSPESLIEHTMDIADERSSGKIDLIVAKSLGTLALPRAIRRGLPGVWLTPLLNRPEVAAALSQADHHHLAVGGTGDRHWMPGAASGSHARLIEVPDADHSLRGSDWRRSLELQTAVFEQINAHLDSRA